MSALTLSIVVYGPGTDANNRSHWAFAVHHPGQERGKIMHVVLISLEKLIYQLEIRDDVTVHSIRSKGSFEIARLGRQDVKRAEKIIEEEPAPRDGEGRCQDWILQAVISLEAEGVVAPGTADEISKLVGKPAVEVARSVGTRWTKTDEEDE